MNIFLIRHGETKEGKKGIILGKLGGKLNNKGIKFAKDMGASFVNLGLDRKNSLIISSDLKRAKDTAKIINKITGIPIRFDKLLQERSAGKSEGKKESEINWEEYEKKTLIYRKHLKGESFMEVRKRAIKFLNKIKNIKKDNLIIVSHNSLLAMLISKILKLSYKKAIHYKFDKSIPLSIPLKKVLY